MTTVIINAEAINKVHEYFAKYQKFYTLIQLYPLKEGIIAEYTDDIDQEVEYKVFSENGETSCCVYDSLDDAILSSILKLDVNDGKILRMLKSLKA